MGEIDLGVGEIDSSPTGARITPQILPTVKSFYKPVTVRTEFKV